MKNLVRLEHQHLSLTEYVTKARLLGVGTADALWHFDISSGDEIFANDTYVVIRRNIPPEMNPQGFVGVKWLSIKRKDGTKVRSWADLQQIKHEMFGAEGEAVEVFPAASRTVNAANQYHLFGGSTWNAPFGFPKE